MNPITYLRSKLQPSYCDCIGSASLAVAPWAAINPIFQVGIQPTPIALAGVPVKLWQSVRSATLGGPADNNCLGAVFALQDGTALVWNSGYGDVRQGTAGNARSAAFDALDAHSCMQQLGLSPACAVHFVAPHGHGDHINPALLGALAGLGHQVLDITFHAGDASRISALPGWTTDQKAAWRSVRGLQCAAATVYLLQGLYQCSLKPRAGHTPGSWDLYLYLASSFTPLAVFEGSKHSTRCVVPAGVPVYASHGNIQ